ncbi:hypothetical protein MRX96_020159 [Rhipicephalus microplus]
MVSSRWFRCFSLQEYKGVCGGSKPSLLGETISAGNPDGGGGHITAAADAANDAQGSKNGMRDVRARFQEEPPRTGCRCYCVAATELWPLLNGTRNSRRSQGKVAVTEDVCSVTSKDSRGARTRGRPITACRTTRYRAHTSRFPFGSAWRRDSSVGGALVEGSARCGHSAGGHS